MDDDDGCTSVRSGSSVGSLSVVEGGISSPPAWCSGGARGRGYCLTTQNRKATVRPAGAERRRAACTSDEREGHTGCRSDPFKVPLPANSRRARRHCAEFAQVKPLLCTGDVVSGCVGREALTRWKPDPFQMQGARHERTGLPGSVTGIEDRIDHYGSPVGNHPVSHPVPDGRSRFGTPLRTAGVDGAYRPVAPARALAR